MKLPGLLAGFLFSGAAFAGEVYVATVSHQSGSYRVEVDALEKVDKLGQLAKTAPVSHNTCS